MEPQEKTSMRRSKHDRYNHSVKGMARDAQRRRGEARQRSQQAFWDRHGGRALYLRERYYHLQQEMGSHTKPNDIYPGFLVVRALKEAEVVDI